ncbi:MAG TPA: nucleotidyltransferase family protein [Casimicrobiaceae bacterium]|nr:nucleotidyltransferase family protein [Casimicrobiaceae bacterium]
MTGAVAAWIGTALKNPSQLLALSLREWEAVIAQARSANLMAFLAMRLSDAGALDDVPIQPRTHFTSALTVEQAQRLSVLRELDHLRFALSSVKADIVLLKGAAYLLANLSMARGRMFTDIDILVPRAHLSEVEAALMLTGWATTHLDAYDQRYYREWMHELPPMRHVTRGTVVDVHHAIVPLTARWHPDSDKLLGAAIAVQSEPTFKVLAPIDMVLHSATHLFQNEELSQGLRDLVDIDALLNVFSSSPAFWRELVERAHELDLSRPLHHALRYASLILHSDVPADVLKSMARAGPARPVQALLDSLFMRGLQPADPDASGRLKPLALGLLYMRAHWLRMPPGLLMRHLAIKAVRREPDDRPI